MAKSSSLSALAYLQTPEKYAPTAVCVVYGGDPFLNRETTSAIRHAVFGGEDDAELSLTVLDGKEAKPCDVFDALTAVSLFGSQRLVVLEAADVFYRESVGETENGADPVPKRGRTRRRATRREMLEKYAENPARDAVLLLNVKTWPKTTRLAKTLAKSQALVVDCSPPDPRGTMPVSVCRVVNSWLIHWAADRHGLQLNPAVAEAMIDIVSLSPGLLDQELAKLVGLVGEDQEISLELVRNSVGNWRTRTTWEMIDAATGGNAAEAIHQLERLLTAGEAPQALFPMFASTLRRFATAGRLVTDGERDGQRIPIQAALKEAGVPPFKLSDAERQLRQLGRERAVLLHRWLLDADLAMKGSHSGGDRPRLVLEQLILRLGKELRV